jgi:hypothetical protein
VVDFATTPRNRRLNTIRTELPKKMLDCTILADHSSFVCEAVFEMTLIIGNMHGEVAEVQAFLSCKPTVEHGSIRSLSPEP